jgi:hypothetical protein
MWWFAATLRKGGGEGPNLHLLLSTMSESPYLQTELPSTFVAHVSSQTRCPLAMPWTATMQAVSSRVHTDPSHVRIRFFKARNRRSRAAVRRSDRSQSLAGHSVTLTAEHSANEWRATCSRKDPLCDAKYALISILLQFNVIQWDKQGCGRHCSIAKCLIEHSKWLRSRDSTGVDGASVELSAYASARSPMGTTLALADWCLSELGPGRSDGLRRRSGSVSPRRPGRRLHRRLLRSAIRPLRA